MTLLRLTRLAPWAALLALLALPSGTLMAAGADGKKESKPAGVVKVSFDKQIRPILQAHCQGCHQPAKAGGAYVMTAFEQMLKGGESGEPAIVSGKPAESHLIEVITPQAGKAEMPQNKPPLAESEIGLLAQWIAQGANDDSPKNVGKRYDMEHPPEYTRLPVIPALAFSPGRLAFGHRRVPRGLALEGRRFRAARSVGGAFPAG